MHESVNIHSEPDSAVFPPFSRGTNPRRLLPGFATAVYENLRNWICLSILFVFFVLVEVVIEPAKRQITEEQFSDLRYPHSKETVPAFLVPLCAILIPSLVYLVVYYSNRDLREFHDLMFSSLMSLTLTALTTSSLKVYVGRLRPDFIERCFGNTNISLSSVHDLNCTTNDEGSIKEGRKSFPSGHSSWMMCSMTFLSLFLIGKSQIFGGRGPGWNAILCLMPMAFAMFVGLTRFHDYRHHWSDVVVGFGIGMFFAVVMYLMYYPSPFQRKGSEIPLYKMQRAQETEHNHPHEEDELELVNLTKV